MSTGYYAGEGGGGVGVGGAGAPYLDDGGGGKGEVVVEEMFFPDEGGEEVGVHERGGVINEGLEMGPEGGGGHVVSGCGDFVAAEVEEGCVGRGAGEEVVKEGGNEVCDGGVV